MERSSIIILGSGNVATHLAKALDAVADVRQIYSRHIDHAAALATQLRACEPISKFEDMQLDADYYILAITDDAIAPTAATMPRVAGIVAHTSGSVPMSVLAPASACYGVFYPLQTFSKHASVDIASAPFFVEGNSPQVCDRLVTLASSISRSVHKADSSTRAVLHLAAVFACNFANHLWAKSSEILGQEGLSLDVLKPLLQATLYKAMAIDPHKAQTGPAMRGDLETMRKHMARLADADRELYRTISQSILDSHNINKTL